jgi:hypothetical protein
MFFAGLSATADEGGNCTHTYQHLYSVLMTNDFAENQETLLSLETPGLSSLQTSNLSNLGSGDRVNEPQTVNGKGQSTWVQIPTLPLTSCVTWSTFDT